MGAKGESINAKSTLPESWNSISFKISLASAMAEKWQFETHLLDTFICLARYGEHG